MGTAGRYGFVAISLSLVRHLAVIEELIGLD